MDFSSTAANLDDRRMPCSKNHVGKTLGVCRQRRNTFGMANTSYLEQLGEGGATNRLGSSGEELS